MLSRRSVAAAAAVTLGLAALQSPAAPVAYTVDTVHSRVTFYVNHLGFSNSVGAFHVAESTVLFDADNWARSSVDVRLPVDSLDLGDAKWQTHLLSADFLDSAQFPDIRFQSTSVEAVPGGQGKLHGNLTIHGVTKPVVLELRLNKAGEHPMRKTPAVGFTATTVVHRAEFGVAAYVPAVADDVEVRIEIEAYVPPKG
jgi:polyisoprenoid-binding protein YceI